MSTIWTFNFNGFCRFKNAEYVFEFEGFKYRLIRGTEEESDKLITIADDSSNKGTLECIERTRQLLDYLSWSLESGMQYLSASGRGFDQSLENFETALVGGYHSRRLPKYLSDISTIPEVTNQTQQFALSLWNEALYSNSKFLSFIDYWNIIELRPHGIPNKKNTEMAINWIDSLKEKDVFTLDRFKKSLGPSVNNTVGKYLYDNGRNALLHISKPKRLERRLSDIARIEEPLNVMRNLASYYIETELGLGPINQPIKIFRTKKHTRALKYLKDTDIR